MLTEAGKYGKLYFAQSEKQSRVSTLTLAQTRDYGPILILSSLCVEIYVQC